MRAVSALLVVERPRTTELVPAVVPVDQVVEKVVRAMVREALHEKAYGFLTTSIGNVEEADVEHVVVSSSVSKRRDDMEALHRQRI